VRFSNYFARSRDIFNFRGKFAKLAVKRIYENVKFFLKFPFKQSIDLRINFELDFFYYELQLGLLLLKEFMNLFR